MAKKTYPQRINRKVVGTVKIGKSLTVGGQAPSVKNLLSAHVQGFPTPMERPDIGFPELNEMLEDRFDVPSPEKYARMDISERRAVMENIRALQKDLTSKLEQQKKDYEQAKATPPEPSPDPTPEA